MRDLRSSARLLVACMVAVVTLGVSAVGASASGNPTVVAAFRDGPVSIHGGNTFATVIGLNVPAGRWLVTAKATVDSVSSPTSTATCRLEAGSDRDTVKVRNGDLVSSAGSAVIGLLVAHRFGSAGRARLRCTSNGVTGADHISGIEVSALKVGKLTRMAIGGSSSSSGTGVPRVVVASRDTSRTLPGDSVYHAIGSIPVPAGSWVLLGKVQVSSASSGDALVDLELFAGSDVDDAILSVRGSGDRAPIALTTEHHSTASGQATLACRSDASFRVSLVRLAAVKAGTLTRTAIGGASHTSGTGAPRIVYGFADGPLAVPSGGALSPVGTLALPAGNWSVRVTLFVKAIDFAPAQSFNVKCQLALGADTDAGVVELDSALGMSDIPFVLQDVHHFSSGGLASVDCGRKGGVGEVDVHFLRIVAVRAGQLTDTAS